MAKSSIDIATITPSPTRNQPDDPSDPFSSLLRELPPRKRKKFRSISRSPSPSNDVSLSNSRKMRSQSPERSIDIVTGNQFASPSPENNTEEFEEGLLLSSPIPTARKPSKYSMDGDYNPEEDWDNLEPADYEYDMPKLRKKGVKRKKAVSKSKAAKKKKLKKKSKKLVEEKPWENDIKYCMRNFGYIPPPSGEPESARSKPKRGGLVRTCITFLQGRRVNVALTRNHISFLCSQTPTRQRFNMGNLFRVESCGAELLLFFVHTKNRLLPVRFVPLGSPGVTSKTVAESLCKDIDAIMKYRKDGIWVNFFIGQHFSWQEALSLHFYLVNLELRSLIDVRDCGLDIKTPYSSFNGAISLIQISDFVCDTYDQLVERDDMKVLESEIRAKKERRIEARKLKAEEEKRDFEEYFAESKAGLREVDDEKMAEMGEEAPITSKASSNSKDVGEQSLFDAEKGAGNATTCQQYPGGLPFLLYDPRYPPKTPVSKRVPEVEDLDSESVRAEQEAIEEATKHAKRVSKLKFRLKKKKAIVDFKDPHRFDTSVPPSKPAKKKKKKVFLPRSSSGGPRNRAILITPSNRKQARNIWMHGVKKLTWTKGQWHIYNITRQKAMYMQNNERDWGKFIPSKEERLKNFETAMKAPSFLTAIHPDEELPPPPIIPEILMLRKRKKRQAQRNPVRDRTRKLVNHSFSFAQKKSIALLKKRIIMHT